MTPPLPLDDAVLDPACDVSSAKSIVFSIQHESIASVRPDATKAVATVATTPRATLKKRLRIKGHDDAVYIHIYIALYI